MASVVNSTKYFLKLITISHKFYSSKKRGKKQFPSNSMSCHFANKPDKDTARKL